MTRPIRLFTLSTAALLLASCGSPFETGLSGGLGTTPSAPEVAPGPSANRPQPDARGVISYPNYQVAVAQRGDTLASLANRIGADATTLGRFNGLQPADTLREGEIIALPGRVAEPLGGPITPGAVDITALAGSAIDAADANQIETTALSPAPQQPQGVSGVEPIRHQVARGETAFSIANLYNVSVSSLADWNGLGSDFAVREGQFLLIPVARENASLPPRAEELAAVSKPGEGSEAPKPPSASKPLPDEETIPFSEPIESTAAPDLSPPEGTISSRMVIPVQGDIIRDYEKGSNEGIDIAAAPGAPVRAAAAGTVAAITEDTNGVPIIVIKHDDNLLTVYSNVGNLAVRKGQSVDRATKIAEVRNEGSTAVHFEVREGFDSVDPNPYLN